MRRGLVTNLYRRQHPDLVDGQPGVTALLDDGTEIHSTISGIMPPPMAWAVFNDDGPPWHCDGPDTASVEPVLREHFTKVPTLIASGALACDTNWDVLIAGAGAPAVAQGGSGLGTLYVQAATALNAVTTVRKDDNAIAVPAAPAGLWLSTQAAHATATTARELDIGFIDNSFVDAVYYRFNSTVAVSDLVTIAASSVGSDASSHVPVAGTYDDIDIVFMSATYAMCWINGGLAGTVRTNVPSAAVGIATRIVNLTAGTNRGAVVDHIHVDRVEPLITPDHPLFSAVLALAA